MGDSGKALRKNCSALQQARCKKKYPMESCELKIPDSTGYCQVQIVLLRSF